MRPYRVLVSLMTSNNDYQREQATAVEQSARRLGVQIEILYADNDSITQSQQILNYVQKDEESRPDAIICHPVGTALAQVARAAVQKGVGWVILNREMEYLTELRDRSSVPIFSVTVDQEEVGRIQARHFGALVPDGGLVVYIQGSSGNYSSERRMAGMQSIKPRNIEIRTLRGNFTEASGYDAVKSWLRLSTSREANVRLVGSQNDAMAIGARRAFMEDSPTHWGHVLFTGCDASPDLGQQMIRNGSMSASITLPTTAGLALEMLIHSLDSGQQPTASTVLMPTSYPPLEKLGAKGQAR